VWDIADLGSIGAEEQQISNLQVAVAAVTIHSHRSDAWFQY